MDAQPRCFRVVANARAGSVLEAGVDVFARRIADAFAAAGCRAEVELLPPRLLHDHLRAAVADEAMIPVIAGGDGTINGALPILVSGGRPVAVLPLGTVNVLGRDLGLVGTLEQQIAAICRGSAVAIDVGSVDGRLFHSISGMGFFSLMARQREYARRRFPFSRLVAFLFAASRSILFTRPISVEMEIGGERRAVEADAVLVTVNRFDGADWRRDRLDGGVFEIHILDTGGLLSRAKAAVSMLRGSWRSSRHLISLTGTSVTLTRRDKRRGHVTFDGEVERRAGALGYRLLPGALRVIAPPREA
ncbi:diacylglycerol kinase family protein [Bosea sp. CS1GBMeth4]|uniref:diacylglycerol/lipid kinase family protein n=1 Tax=Bosea sp. CS1GBMeth4 TaxID=1892849 RepID=UPI001647080D|nr:diacylglycerol kinase family protein [Bosea sp. CS1GBMeth4]